MSPVPLVRLVLLAVSLVTGTLTGFASALLFRAMAHVKLSK